MFTPTRQWEWPREGYTKVRLQVGDDILPPTRGQIESQVESIVKAAQSVNELETKVRSIPSPYLPLSFQVASAGDRSDSGNSVDIEVHVRRR